MPIHPPPGFLVGSFSMIARVEPEQLSLILQNLKRELGEEASLKSLLFCFVFNVQLTALLVRMCA